MSALVVVIAVAQAAGCATSSNPEERERHRRARRYDGPVIDVHTHVSAADSVAADEAWHKNTADPHLTRVGAVVIASSTDARLQNDRALSLAKADPKVFAVASVNPSDPGALAEIDRVVDAGAKMIALDPVKQKLDLADARVAAVVQHCGERAVPVMIEADAALSPGVLGKALDVAIAHPQSQLVLAHMGFTHFSEAAMFLAAKRNPAFPDNVFFDVSSTATLYSKTPYADDLAWLIRKLQKNVMFGSDFPLDTSSSAIDAVQTLGLEEDEQADVLYGNAARLLKL